MDSPGCHKHTYYLCTGLTEGWGPTSEGIYCDRSALMRALVEARPVPPDTPISILDCSFPHGFHLDLPQREQAVSIDALFGGRPNMLRNVQETQTGFRACSTQPWSRLATLAPQNDRWIGEWLRGLPYNAQDGLPILRKRKRSGHIPRRYYG